VTQQAEPSRPLRVALVITELNVGGAERCVTNLALGLDRNRFEPNVISLAARPADSQAGLVTQLEAASVPVEFLELQSPYEILQGFSRLQQRFARTTPDVVQTFLVHANLLGVAAARRAGIRGVATGIRVTDPRQRRWWMERLAAWRADRVVSVSEATAQAARRRGEIAAGKIVVIPNGIDVSRFDNVPPANPAAFGIAPERRVIAVIGRLDRQKGLDWLLSLAPGLLQQVPRHDLLVVGDGARRGKYQSQAAEMGLAPRVHFAGWRPDVPAILAASDLLLLPSRWEGMPNVVLEAMASRLPVVATRSEGVCELLGDGSDRQTVAFGLTEAFIAQAVAILNDPTLAAGLAAENRRRAAEHFSLRGMICQYQELFQQLAQCQ
jgi:glycosyltransferase involved in cell wall biosynthesis